MTRAHWLTVLAYVVPTFLIAYQWHLNFFAHRYESLEIYRADLLVPLGFLAVLLQGFIYAYCFGNLFGKSSFAKQAVSYGAGAAVLSWTYTTLAIAAKFPMTSVGGYLLLESGFTLVQFAVVGPLTALAWRMGNP